MDKTIKINGEEYLYRVESWYDSDWGYTNETHFFKEYFENKRKKFLFFGKEIITKEPLVLFKVDLNIESVFYTKHEVREKVEAAERKFFEQSRRKREVENGEII
jgi:hypothetical protein